MGRESAFQCQRRSPSSYRREWTPVSPKSPGAGRAGRRHQPARSSLRRGLNRASTSGTGATRACEPTPRRSPAPQSGERGAEREAVAEETRERGPDGRPDQEAMPAARTCRTHGRSLGHRFGARPAADPAPGPVGCGCPCPAGSRAFRAFPAPRAAPRASAFVFSGLFSALLLGNRSRGFPPPAPRLPSDSSQMHSGAAGQPE